MAADSLPAPMIETKAEVYRSSVARRRRVMMVSRVALLLGLLVLWQAASGTVLNPFWVSRPSDIVVRLAEWVSEGTIFDHALATFEELAGGLIIGVAAGVGVALILGMQRTLAAVLRPYVVVAYSFPQLALTPLYILWFGIDLLPKIVLVATVVFFLMFFNTFQGVQEVDRDLMGTMRVMGAGRYQLLRMVILPSVAVWIITGMRHAVPFGLRAAVFGEFMVAAKGLGFLAKNASMVYDSTGLFASLVVLLIVAVSLNALVNFQEKATLRSRASVAGG